MESLQLVTIYSSPAEPKPKPKPTPKPTKAEGIISSTNKAPLSLTQQSPLVGIKLSTLVKSLDPSGLFTLEPDAEEQLLALANDFANSLIKKSMRVAQHRHAVGSNSKNNGTDAIDAQKRKRVEADDVAIVLKKNYGITIPGLPSKTARRKGNSGALLSSVSALRRVGLGSARALGSGMSSQGSVDASSRAFSQTEGED